jgi:hypothetical protein
MMEVAPSFLFRPFSIKHSPGSLNKNANVSCPLQQPSTYRIAAHCGRRRTGGGEIPMAVSTLSEKSATSMISAFYLEDSNIYEDLHRISERAQHSCTSLILYQNPEKMTFCFDFEALFSARV